MDENRPCCAGMSAAGAIVITMLRLFFAVLYPQDDLLLRHMPGVRRVVARADPHIRRDLLRRFRRLLIPRPWLGLIRCAQTRKGIPGPSRALPVQGWGLLRIRTALFQPVSPGSHRRFALWDGDGEDERILGLLALYAGVDAALLH